MPSNRKKATRIDQDRKGVVFHHDNATSLTTRQKLRELDWEILMHPPYSPDLALSDYHLFRSLQNSLNDVKFTSKACENYLLQFLSRNHRSSTDGIMILQLSPLKNNSTKKYYYIYIIINIYYYLTQFK